MDLRTKFGMGPTAADKRNCIVVLDSMANDTPISMGIAVDSVSEVMAIKASDIEATPDFGMPIDTRHVLAMAKTENSVKQLLDIDHVLLDEGDPAQWLPPTPENEPA